MVKTLAILTGVFLLCAATESYHYQIKPTGEGSFFAAYWLLISCIFLHSFLDEFFKKRGL